MAIFYNKKKVSLRKWGTFWLSETPDEPSLGWDGACRRTMTWALMKEKKSGKKFFFVDTHLDHVGTVAREKGVELIMSKIAGLNKDNLPVVLVGDFNVSPSDPVIADIEKTMKNTRKIAAETDNIGTYNDWGKASEIIDNIFYRGFKSCTLFETVTAPYADRKFISDHYPIKAVLVF